MNEITSVQASEARQQRGMDEAEAAYMRGDAVPPTASLPLTTSKFLNSPLYVHAFANMALRRNGRDIPPTYDLPNMSRAIADVTDYSVTARLIAEEREKNPLLAAWLDARRPLSFDTEALQAHGEGTLGAEVRKFLVDSGMDMRFAYKFEAKTDLEYMLQMAGHTHDIQHIATGFWANYAGEVALSFMNIASCYRHLSPELAGDFQNANVFVATSWLSRAALNHRQALPLILHASRLGITAGEALKTPLFMIPWHDHLDWKLEDIAAHYGFERGPGAGWDHSEDLCRD
jgi:ubiquinone biosynthesis protein Coq4